MISLTENKIAISPLRDPDMTASGRLYIPDVAKERCDQGIVKHIGPKVKDVKIGDHVLFGGYDGVMVNIEGEGSLIILREQFIKTKFLHSVDPSVPGLYFRAKANKEDMGKLNVVIRKYTSIGGSDSGGVINVAEAETELFDAMLTYINSVYFPATYEMAVDLVAEMWSNSGITGRISAKNNIDDREKYFLENEEDIEDGVA